MMILIAVLAVALAANSLLRNVTRPDLTISAADVAWATNTKIWKFDLTDAGEVYGLQVVVFENGGTSKRWICRVGGGSRLNNAEYPVVKVCMKSEGGVITGKLGYQGSTIGFETGSLLKGSSVSSTNPPALRKDSDIYYLMSDSQTVGFGAEPFSETSNKIALELLRTPNAS